MSRVVRVNARLEIPWSELSFAASRASGPGGQHVNTTDSRIELRWRPAGSAALSGEQRERLLARLGGRLNRRGELVLACAQERSQHRNREIVLERFAALLRQALAVRRPRRPTAPSASSRERRLDAKRRRAAVKRRRTGGPGAED